MLISDLLHVYRTLSRGSKKHNTIHTYLHT